MCVWAVRTFGATDAEMIELKFMQKEEGEGNFNLANSESLNTMLHGREECEYALCKACSAGEEQIKMKGINVCVNAERKGISVIGSRMWGGNLT